MMRKLLLGIVVLGLGGLARATWPDVQRYLRIRAM